MFFFFFNDTATTEIYTLSLHDALPISPVDVPRWLSSSVTAVLYAVTKRRIASSSAVADRVTVTVTAVASEFEDRKSTRLNSSHANISYAVFCLKKKKKDLNTSLIITRT